MPAALNVNREAVKTLAMAIGIRAAARETGLSESTVKSWSDRGKWLVKPDSPPTVIRRASSASISPSDAMAAIGERTKLSLARTGEKAAKRFEKMKASEVISKSGHYKNVVDGASKLHGWDTRFQGESFNLNLLNLGGIVSIDTPKDKQS